MKTRLLAILFISALFIYGCRKEFGKPGWDTNILAPILHTTLGINNLIADSLLSVNGDQSVTLVFNNTVFNLSLDSLLHIPDTTIGNHYSLPFGQASFAPGHTLINATSQTTYILNGPELKKASVRSGYIRVYIRNEIKEKVIVSYQLPDARKNNIPFSKSFTVAAATTTSAGIFTDTFHINGYEIDLRGQFGNSFNTIRSTYIAQIDPAALQNVTVVAGDSVSLFNSFVDIVPQYAQGYFGSTSYSFSDTSAFDVFKHIVGGSLLLDSVRMNLRIDNTVGADSRVKISNLTSINTHTNNSVSLTHPVIGTTVNITRAFDANGTVIPTIYSFFLDNGNSNIKNMIENLPDNIGYTIDAQINPLGNVSGGHDFIYYGDGIKVNLDAEIPLHFAAGQLTFADTVSYSISENSQVVDEGTLTLFAENGFPFEAGIKLYIVNQNGVIIDSLMPPINVIDDAPVNVNYVVIQPKLTVLSIPLSKSKMQNLYANKKIYMRISFNTIDYPQLIKIYSHYKMDIKLTGDFMLNVNH